MVDEMVRLFAGPSIGMSFFGPSKCEAMRVFLGKGSASSEGATEP